MTDSIIVNHDIVGATAKTLLSEQGSLESASESYKEALSSLFSAWQGSAATSFMLAGATVGDDFDVIISSIGSLSGKLSESDQHFSETDSAIASSF